MLYITLTRTENSYCHQGKGIMKLYIIIIFILCILNVIADYGMTEYALDNGYYETNRFTASTSPMLHMILLICILSVMTIFPLWIEELRLPCIFGLSLFCLAWTANNIYSVMLLS